MGDRAWGVNCRGVGFRPWKMKHVMVVWASFCREVECKGWTEGYNDGGGTRRNWGFSLCLKTLGRIEGGVWDLVLQFVEVLSGMARIW